MTNDRHVLQVSDLLKKMCPDAPGLRVVLKSKKIWELQNTVMDAFDQAQLKHEPWFGVNYIQFPISQDTINTWTTVSVPSSLYLPPK